jgi:hypothetical protein
MPLGLRCCAPEAPPYASGVRVLTFRRTVVVAHASAMGLVAATVLLVLR